MKDYKRSHLPLRDSASRSAMGRSHPLLAKPNVRESRAFKRFAVFSLCALICVFSLVGNFDNKAYALSNPNYNADSVYTGVFQNALFYQYGASREINLNSTMYASGVNYPYFSAISEPNQFICTTIDHTRTNGGMLTNQYYDQQDTDTNNSPATIYLTQSYSPQFNSLNLLLFRTNSYSIGFNEPKLMYIPNGDIFNNIKLWYYTSNGADLTNFGYDITYDNLPNPFTLKNTSEQSTLMKVTFSYGFMRKLTEEDKRNGLSNRIDFEHIVYSNIASVGYNNNITIPSEIYENIRLYGIQHNYCYLFNYFNINVEFFQRNSVEVAKAYDNPTRYGFNNLSNQDIETLYTEPLYVSAWALLPFYTEPYSVVQNKLKLANDLYLTPYLSDKLSINYFWDSLINFEIFPNFKLSYFLIMAFGLTLVIIFVRMFR